jgi:excisionase family DNA binding protein
MASVDKPLRFEVTLPPETVEEIAQRVAELASGLSGGGLVSPWLTRAEAAEYLRLPVSRLEKDRRIPVHPDGGRVLYHRDELDAHFLALGR